MVTNAKTNAKTRATRREKAVMSLRHQFVDDAVRRSQHPIDFRGKLKSIPNCRVLRANKAETIITISGPVGLIQMLKKQFNKYYIVGEPHDYQQL